MHNFRKLKVWQKSVDFTLDMYKITESFPTEEKYGLIRQIRKAAVSVSSNIASGYGRQTDKDFSNSLGNALSVINKLETELIISQKLNYISSDNFRIALSSLAEIQKMIVGLQNSLNDYKISFSTQYECIDIYI